MTVSPVFHCAAFSAAFIIHLSGKEINHKSLTFAHQFHHICPKFTQTPDTDRCNFTDKWVK